MAFDIFSTLIRPRKKEKPGDRFELLVHKIEQFAPKEYATERETHYYNYKIINHYRNPLERLLETIYQYKQSHGDPLHSAEIFSKLKFFYDINNHLTVEEAIKDRNLAIKFIKLLLFFYHSKEESAETVRARMIEGMAGKGLKE